MPPVGIVMGNCVYYVSAEMLQARMTQSLELSAYTHALYDARELAIERLQDEAEALDATGIVGVTVSENQHSWPTNPWNIGNAALESGELIELFVIGTAVVPISGGGELPEPELVSNAMRAARQSAIRRMRAQARELGADGVVDVRLEVEHHLWRGARQVAKCIAVGTAVVFDRAHAPEALRSAPSLRLSTGAPFDSDLSGGDFVTLLAAGYRPVTVAMGNCVYGLDPASCGAIAARTPRSLRSPRHSSTPASSRWSACKTICSRSFLDATATPPPASSG